MDNISCWLQSTLQRVYPSTPAQEARPFKMPAARNERLSFQACARNHAPETAEVSVTVAPQNAPEMSAIVRRVGYVPMVHLNTDTPEDELEGIGNVPGLVPDPLFPEQVTILGPHETQSFWVNVNIPADAQTGLRKLLVTFTRDGKPLSELVVWLDVQPLVIQPRQGLPVTHWFYADALCDWYEVEPFDDRFWALVEPYMADLTAHGSTCQYVPIFTPPTDGVKRPTQLLKISEPFPGQFWFDFSDVRRWTRLAQKHGAQYFEWTHLFTQWGVQNAIRIYRNNRDPNSLLWQPNTAASSETYRQFLAQFLPQFHTFLTLEGLMNKSFFHLSDEPQEEHMMNYRAARNTLKALAPWMKISDALSHVDYGRIGLTDIPIPSIATAKDFAAEGIPSWAYFCCGPRGRYLNRLMDTPLAKIRMTGWLLYRLNAQGFLHWGYNYWYKSQTQQLLDPFSEQAGMAYPGWAYGDTFVVYPGEAGPLDSIRWEVFGESLQDYALLQTLGVARDDARLAELKDYNDFPKTAAWIDAARAGLLGV